MKQILLIGSLLMLVSSCEKAAVTSVFATVFLKNANKPLADLETEVVVIDENSQTNAQSTEVRLNPRLGSQSVQLTKVTLKTQYIQA